MMEFVLQQDFAFEAQVHVRRPDGVEQAFTGVFRVIPLTPETRNTELVEALQGWRGVVLPDNTTLAVTPENRAALLSWPFVRQAIANAYLEEISRLPEKNSARPAAPGPAPAAARLNGVATS